MKTNIAVLPGLSAPPGWWQRQIPYNKPLPGLYAPPGWWQPQLSNIKHRMLAGVIRPPPAGGIYNGNRLDLHALNFDPS